MAPDTEAGGDPEMGRRRSLTRLADLPDGEEKKVTILQILTKSSPVDPSSLDEPGVFAYRERNLQWRTGSHAGAVGEIMDLTPKPKRAMFDDMTDEELLMSQPQRCASWPSLPDKKKPQERQVWMLSEELESDLKAVYPEVWRTLQSRIVQGMILVLVIFTYAACPLTVSLAQVVGYDDLGVPIKGRPFKEGSVIVISWALIATVGLLLSFAVGGRESIHQIFDRHAILTVAPAGIGWALADVCEVLAVARLDPATYGVISQARLLGVAAAMWLIRGMRQSRLQWGILAVLSLVCMAYCMVTDEPVPNKVRLLKWRLARAEVKVHWLNAPAVEEELDGAGEKDEILGVLLALGKVILSVLSGVYGESCFKAMKDSKGQPLELQVQMTQISFSSTIAAFMGYCVICRIQEQDPSAFFSGPDGTWGWTTLLVAVVYCWREWICNICVKRFDSLVKNICNAMALVITYGFTVYDGLKPFSPLKALLLLAVVLEVVNYSTTRRQAPKPDEASEEDVRKKEQSDTLDFAGEYSQLRRRESLELQGLSRGSSFTKMDLLTPKSVRSNRSR